ncbi:MbnP family protein [Portibacter lacus]|uniref:Copper-binding protein MbnP-like domain-containing protein n=1 Tax=Portibacter lacus TaxID=1099794 RepID=A0AA37SSI5_9BACT|nr:MbnP family protein [Portibacter lacus]GLR19628.1 hypothetical protein GCM10007940_42440 [Portibacter lacus]
MKNIILLAIGIIVLSSCKQEGDFNLNFKGLFKDDALVLNQAYELDDISVKFENLGFLLTDISIVNDDNESVELADAEFVALNGVDQAGAEAGQVLSYNNIPTGTYTKLKFTIGVPEDLNATVPGDYAITDPLGRSDYYWEAWGSYIFSKTEGNADVSGDGVYDLKFFYHTGSDALKRSFELDREIVIDKNSTSTLELFLDYNELLRNADGTAFDIEASPRNHDPNKLEIVTQLVDNYARAIKVRS